MTSTGHNDANGDADQSRARKEAARNSKGVPNGCDSPRDDYDSLSRDPAVVLVHGRRLTKPRVGRALPAGKGVP